MWEENGPSENYSLLFPLHCGTKYDDNLERCSFNSVFVHIINLITLYNICQDVEWVFLDNFLGKAIVPRFRKPAYSYHTSYVLPDNRVGPTLSTLESEVTR